MSTSSFVKGMAINGVAGLITCTWATKPASPAIGTLIKLTDHRNNICMWNGSLWIPQGAWVQSNAVQSWTGDTTEKTLATVVIPGGLLGPNSAFRVSTAWSMVGTAGSKAARMRFNGAGTGLSNVIGSTVLYIGYVQTVRNNNSLTSQKMPPYISDNSSATGVMATTSINTANDLTLTLTGQCNVATDTLTLEGFTVEILS